jgi:hypothetical protein
MNTDEQKINDEDKLMKIKGGQDGNPPFSAADDVKQGGPSSSQYPTTDTDMDADEEYQEGTQAASGFQTDENPDEDQRGTRVG